MVEFEKVMHTVDFVSELSSILSTPRVSRSGYANAGENAFYCFNFPDKKANLFVIVKEIKEKFLSLAKSSIRSLARA